MKKVKIAHITDLHLTGNLKGETDAADVLNKNWPFNKGAGHSYELLLNLTEALNSINFDLLLITGDITKKGGDESFKFAHTWLEKAHSNGMSNFVGLDLGVSSDKYVIVPGNHDYYNKVSLQSNSESYQKYFGVIDSDTTFRKVINGVVVNVHLYDSTKVNKIAIGEIKDEHKIDKNLKNDELDIAMLHHHIALPPNVKNDWMIELSNMKENTNYLLSQGFNSIIFGHTHNYLQEFISNEVIMRNFPDKRSYKRDMKNIRLSNLIMSCNSVSYKRENANGQYPTFGAYMEYIYIKANIDDSIKGPSKFKNIGKFYEELEKYKREIGNIDLSKIFERKLHISMAESACKKYEKSNGFNVFEYNYDNRILTCEKYKVTPDSFSRVALTEYKF